MKVMIGLSTAEDLRKAEFLPYFMSLNRPENSMQCTVHGQSPAKSRNLIAERALENNCTHILFLDDDMTPPGDTLMKLLKHDKDVVSALYLLRSYPHYPAAFNKKYWNGKNKHAFLTSDMTGLVPITNCGLGCVLVKIEVFKKLEKPWVRLAELAKDEWCDDIGFFNRVGEAGFEMFCDLDTPVGHINNISIWPEKKEHGWFTTYKNMNGNITFPQYIPTREEMEKQEIDNEKDKLVDSLTPI